MEINLRTSLTHLILLIVAALGLVYAGCYLVTVALQRRKKKARRVFLSGVVGSVFWEPRRAVIILLKSENWAL